MQKVSIFIDFFLLLTVISIVENAPIDPFPFGRDDRPDPFSRTAGLTRDNDKPRPSHHNHAKRPENYNEHNSWGFRGDQEEEEEEATTMLQQKPQTPSRSLNENEKILLQRYRSTTVDPADDLRSAVRDAQLGITTTDLPPDPRHNGLLKDIGAVGVGFGVGVGVPGNDPVSVGTGVSVGLDGSGPAGGLPPFAEAIFPRQGEQQSLNDYDGNKDLIVSGKAAKYIQAVNAANGAGAQPGDPLAVILQYRGLAFQIGGDKSLDEHITVANVLRKFNPDLIGPSKGIGSENVWEVAHLNMGVPGAESRDLIGQARALVNTMKAHPEINIKEDWKLVNIFIGANDICVYCEDVYFNATAPHGSTTFENNIIKAVTLLQQNLPRTIVSLTSMFNMRMLRKIDKKKYFCEGLHIFECDCESNKKFTDDDIQGVCFDYMGGEKEIESSGIFDGQDDFTFVVQPFFNNIMDPPYSSPGVVDMTFFAPDCFHFSAYGHANIGMHLWNTIVQPVGQKQTSVNLSDPSVGLHCPDSACPFFPTTKNSINCSGFMTLGELD
uniref:Lipase_GDSL domain-containing protein n=1 Tax=Caenorhabditis japonica TaxID=281687 RepID=A0A8R1HM15_CAEJA